MLEWCSTKRKISASRSPQKVSCRVIYPYRKFVEKFHNFINRFVYCRQTDKQTNRQIHWSPYVIDVLASHNNYSARSYASAEYWIIHFTARFGDVHMFGYNSAESGPIWIIFELLWVYCWGLARQTSDSQRARQILCFCQIVSQISRRPNFTKFEHNTSIGVAMKSFGIEFWKFKCKGPFV